MHIALGIMVGFIILAVGWTWGFYDCKKIYTKPNPERELLDKQMSKLVKEAKEILKKAQKKDAETAAEEASIHYIMGRAAAQGFMDQMNDLPNKFDEPEHTEEFAIAKASYYYLGKAKARGTQKGWEEKDEEDDSGFGPIEPF